MKKIILFIITLFLCVHILNAQWITTGTNTTTTDNIGIGTTTPTEKLTINSTGGISGCAYYGVPALKINWTDPTGFITCPGGVTGNIPAIMSIVQSDLFSSASPLFTLQTGGSLGIGTANPGAKLHVAGTGKFEGSASTDFVKMYNTSNNLGSTTSVLTVGLSSNQNANPYLLKLYGTTTSSNHGDRFVVKNDGQVGIGISDPRYKLSVAGGIIVDDGAHFNGNVTTGEDYVIKFGDASHGEAIGSMKSGGNNIHGLNFYTAYQSRMSITNSGAVTIGNVSTPSGYKLYVEQGILTEQVKVAVRTTNDWSDFVFKPNYNLMPLDEVACYIESNHHLPNVPSAEAVVKEGINMAIMDAKLLEKIEELTLYSIELNKQLKLLQEKLSNLENKK